MTTPTLLAQQQVEGLHYHEKTKTLHLRLDKHETLREVVALIRKNGNDIWESEFLNLSLTDALFQPEQANVGVHEEDLFQMCAAMGDCLRQLKEIHISRCLSGFINTNVGAWLPVEALQVLLKKSGKLEVLMLRNLQVYSSSQREANNPAEVEVTITLNPVYLLANSLKHHPSLQRFGWQHSECIPRTFPCLDPMLQSLSTIRNLNNMIIQSPPWAVARVPTEPTVLQSVISPALLGLHLDGLHLQSRHIQSLLKGGQTTSLQSLSLSPQLTLSNIGDLGVCLAEFLQRSSSTLLHLGLRLDWLVEDVHAVTRRSFRKQRMAALQDFQTTMASAIIGDSRIQRLDLIYHDSSFHRWDDQNSSAKKSNPFRDVLDTNYTLTHLRLPFCGEMDPAIGFYLKLNRTGVRSRLLRVNHKPSPEECIEALVRVQEQPRWSPNKTCVGLSMVFHLLGEIPALFL